MTTNRAVLTFVAALGLVAANLTLGPVAPAVAAPVCENPKDPGKVIPQSPWAQSWLAPERIWPFTDGSGVKVAVIDSGTDAGHPQLGGKVLAGFDFLRNAAGANFDCVSHGTAVASIIAAQRVQGVGFQGIAPGATILPVRVSDKEVDAQGNTSGETVDPARFAKSIKYAVDSGATVINMSIVLYDDVASVRDAVRYALSNNVVVVAAVGNRHDEKNTGPDPTPYPAAYDGVVGVGAIAEDGSRVSRSQIGKYVDVVAPGGGVIAATRVRGHAYWDGTSFATPFVSGTAALIRAAHPKLSAAEVAQRLRATASPARGGRNSTTHGRGVVDPYRAVTDELATGAPLPPEAVTPVTVDREAEAAAADRRRTTRIALILAGTGGGVAALLLCAAAVLPLGRRRRWLPGRRAPVPEPPAENDEAPAESPEALFAPPRA